MASPDDFEPDAPPPAPGGAATVSGTLIETTLPNSRITVLAPSRVVVVGDGRRLRIDRDGVHRQPLRDVRLVLPMPDDAITDLDLQRTLAQWAGRGVSLHAHELVRSGEGFSRILHLTDDADVRATLDLHSGRTLA